jgi:Dolichyl-phosphate-mannose-protein mannosyltransferase
MRMMSLLRQLLNSPAASLGLATLALHLWVNGSYDYFRDELYFIVCGRHLAWGYVDQPPLVPLIAWASDSVFHSVRGLRLVPALAAAATVALTVSAARMLGGGSYAGWLAGLAVLGGGVLQLIGVLLTTDTLQPLTWLACAVAIIRAEREREPRWWWAVGVIAGVALLAKYMIAVYLGCLAAGLLATPRRRLLAQWQPWAAVLIALAIVTPNLAWQAANDWPFLAQSAQLAEHKNVPLSPAAFLLQEVLTLGPATAPVWLVGLVAFGFWRRFADLRWVAIGWVLLIAAMVAGHGKPYYPASAYPLLMAGGAVALEAWLSRALRAAFTVALVAGAALSAPLVMPVLPVEGFIVYQRWLGLQPSTGERVTLGVLPQYFADMFGWRELAEAVGKAFASLPAEDQRRAVFFGRNYGEAAAIDVFGAPWSLPPAISAHQTYYIWGPRGHDGSVVLLLGGTREELLKGFRSVEPVGWLDNPWGMPYESGQTLWLCRESVENLQQLWPRLRHYG